MYLFHFFSFINDNLILRGIIINLLLLYKLPSFVFSLLVIFLSPYVLVLTW
jgi:hypothetical protein